MRTARLCCVLSLAFLASACSSKPKDQIIGKWSGKDGETDLTMEFNKDGTMKTEVKGGLVSGSVSGKYKFVDDNTIEMEVDVGDQKQTKKARVTIEKDKMTLTDDKDKKLEYTRAK
jgi:uncharacterized protein (TIGR03066 family)